MATRAEFERLNATEVKEFLVDLLHDEVQEESLAVLEDNRVSGKTFFKLDDEDLREIFPLMGERKAIKRTIEEHKPKEVLRLVC